MQLRRGFTLIELLVVIAIIGILASVVLVNLNTARLRARNAERISTVDQVKLALQLFFDDNQAYPTTAQLPAAPGVWTNAPVGLLGTYLPKQPNTVAGATTYTYFSTGPTNYCFGVYLEAGGTMPGNDTNCAADTGNPGTSTWDTDALAYSVSP